MQSKRNSISIYQDRSKGSGVREEFHISGNTRGDLALSRAISEKE
jgi:hypothetical protein